MPATHHSLVRLLTQEREVLSALLELATRQEEVMLAADLGALDDLVSRESALLQREARLALHISTITRAHGGVAGAIAALPAQHQEQAALLRRDLLGLAAQLNTVSARLKAMAEAGLNRVEFLYQVIARGGQQPGPYRMARVPGARHTAVLNQRV